MTMAKWMSGLSILFVLFCWGVGMAWGNNQNIPSQQEETSSSFNVPTEVGASLNQDFGKPSDLIQIEDAMREPDNEPVIVIEEEPIYDKHGRVEGTVTGTRKNYEEEEPKESKGAVIAVREEIKYKSRDIKEGFKQTETTEERRRGDDTFEKFNDRSSETRLKAKIQVREDGEEEGASDEESAEDGATKDQTAALA